MIILVNKKDNYIPTADDIYIGRGSPLGNPYSFLDFSKAEFKVENRAAAIKAYAEWLPKQQGEVDAELEKIQEKNLSGRCRLVCHCVPLACHGTEIRKEVWRRFGIRVGIIGSRSFNDRDKGFDALDKIRAKSPWISKVVSGGANGADKIGEEWAKSREIHTQIFLPDWDTHGKKAGFLRNQDIVKNSDIIIAFWDGQSKGTQHSINLAKEQQIPVIIR